MSIPDAPWIGSCKEESFRHDPEFVGYCAHCGRSVYEDDDYEYRLGELVCDDCTYGGEGELD